ncbi:tetratricopeptide repeat protein [Natronoflexus pectinivorans]|uniref:Tetratricopeptide repeat protein n=1 Tax=Natronoflexus pectinivorans TaxID=682526 RepID=A0A4R2GKE2_9BACT|nr:tetratricopeptide repeat protein [Natronoflexus pectinivorans]TCO09284.1 tetratricopeptide repeat protein [Natronoflexus pectinivorans]
MSKKENTSENKLENVEQALGRTERFIEENQKTLTIAVLALILIVGGYWAYIKLYSEPQEAEAQRQMFHAQIMFENEDYSAALEGDGINPGFLEIIDNFGRTKAGNLSRYYAGISYLHIGEYEEAIRYLRRFKTKNDKMNAVSLGAIGDAHAELGDINEAIRWYQRASQIENSITAPFFLLKKGLAYESIGDNVRALEAFRTIKEKYRESTEARQIDKYITRVSL